MKKSLCALAILVVAFCSTAWSETKVFQISVTIPATAYLNAQQNSQMSIADQLPQTQQMIRDNRSLLMTSIVIP